MFVPRNTFEEVQRKMEAGEFDTGDIYKAVAAYVLGVPSALVTNDQRRAAKSACFVHLYGAPR